jgi:FAD/FMN-containing dehydrogenase
MVRSPTAPAVAPEPVEEASSEPISRRRFLGGAAALAALGAVPAFRISPASAQATCAPPPNFPAGISLYQQAYRNWSGEIQVDGVWTCVPQTPAHVVTIANWARANNYKIRPRGRTHNWSPLTLTPGSNCSVRIVLVDTTQFLKTVTIVPGTPVTVRAQTGVTMESLLTTLENAGYGMTATPAPGDLTLGGVLAIDGHGTAVPATGETRIPGHTYGSLSNLIVSVTAVVWDPVAGQYVLKTFNRSDAQSLPFLAHVGRAFLTEVTLQTGANYRLRCQSWFDIPASEMFAPSGSSGRTFQSYVESAGRVEAIWFPFTSNPWLKVWRVSPSKPLFSRTVTSPYNYSFSDNLPPSLTDLIAQIVSGNVSLTPSFGQTNLSVVGAGLISTGTWDIWGWSKNLLLYVRPTTLRVTANGYAIVTRRSNIQRVVNEFTTFYQSRVAAYQALGRFPMNGPVEIRVTGLDQAADVAVPSAGPPVLSAVRPRPDHTDWNVAVWLDILTIPGTPYANQFYREIETWVFSNYASYAAVRPEWSKGWGYTNGAAWADSTILGTTVPNAYRAGLSTSNNWDWARGRLNTYDPHRIFSNGFLDALLP